MKFLSKSERGGAVTSIGSTQATTRQLAERTLRENRVAIFIVAYNAERHIESVLDRVPGWIAKSVAEVFVIDDSSGDATIERAVNVKWAPGHAPLRVFKTPYNQGYGGNQRLGYLYAIEQGFDIVVLLHGDGQYAPESLPVILAEYSRGGGVDAVYGSRFLLRGGALRGRMPLYKYIGNRILTAIQNRLTGLRLSEWHSGYRTYRTSALKRVPFQANSLGFDFDTDIIIQFLGAGLSIREAPIPTYYGNEICRVNGLRYAWACLKTTLQYRLMQMELFYDPKFDVGSSPRKYAIKHAATSLHYHVRNLPLAPGSELLDLGGGDGAAVSLAHAGRGVRVTVVDQCSGIRDTVGQMAAAEKNLRRIEGDLDGDWTLSVQEKRFSAVFVLDVLEHLKSPELAVRRIFSVMAPDGKIYASTGNVAFWAIRLVLLLGHFNYGRRGILDLTHTRLFTVSSFCRLLRNAGFRIDAIQCFGPPVTDLIAGESKVLRGIDRISATLARVWKNLFAYQIFIEATRPSTVEDLVARTFEDYRVRAASSSD